MTHEETIRALDGVIVYLNRFVTTKNLPYNLIEEVVRNLKGMDISSITIRNVANINIENPTSLSSFCMDLHHLEVERQNNNRTAIQSIISILKTEQEQHKQILIEEEKQKAIEEQTKNLELQEKAIAEQKKGNQIQYKAYLCSIFAMLIALVSLIVAICK